MIVELGKVTEETKAIVPAPELDHGAFRSEG
jgi:hypothetical protein